MNYPSAFSFTLPRDELSSLQVQNLDIISLIKKKTDICLCSPSLLSPWLSLASNSAQLGVTLLYKTLAENFIRQTIVNIWNRE